MAVLAQIMLNQGSYAGHQFWNAQVQDQFTSANSFDPSYGLGWRRAGDPTSRALKWFSLLMQAIRLSVTLGGLEL